MSTTPATPAASGPPTHLEQVARGLEAVAGLHAQLGEALRTIAQTLEQRDAETAELRDEVLALSNRIEAVHRAIGDRRDAGSRILAAGIVRSTGDLELIRSWNADDYPEGVASSDVENELRHRGYTTRDHLGGETHLNPLGRLEVRS